MTQATQHTPTPWCTMYSGTVIRGFDGTDVAIGLNRLGPRDNAAHIVRCVNAHDELVAALRMIESYGNDMPMDSTHRLHKCLIIARAALAKIS
jgi:hypothetical protein